MGVSFEGFNNHSVNSVKNFSVTGRASAGTRENRDEVKFTYFFHNPFLFVLKKMSGVKRRIFGRFPLNTEVTLL